MKKFLLALAFCLGLPSIALAQCNGVFPASTVCGVGAAGANIPGPLPLSSFALTPSGATGSIQTNGGGGVFGNLVVGSGLVVAGGTLSAVGAVPTPQGRLTLTSGTAVMATSVAGATTIFYTSYGGNNVPIYDGTNVVNKQLCAANTAGACENSVALGSNWTANTNYDFFEALDSTTLRLCSGPSWNAGAVAGSDTARGTGAGSTDLQQFAGFQTNKNSITCRYNNTTTFAVAANQATYVGSCRMLAAGQTQFIFGASSAGGTAGQFYCWSAYNTKQFRTTVTDTGPWTYVSATIRSLNNSTGNRVSFIMGLAEDSIASRAQIRPSVPAGGIYKTGMALDATNALDKQAFLSNATAVALNQGIGAANDYNPQLGFHFIQATEASDGANTATLNGGIDQGLIVELSM